MKKTYIVLFLLVTTMIMAQKKKVSFNKKLPYIQFLEYEYDFGDISYSGMSSHKFYFTNKGKGPLLIKNVRKS